MEYIDIIPNLSIGVISVLALVYTVMRFLKAMDDRTIRHEAAMQERETALRLVEKEVRNNLYTTLTQASLALQENTKALERVINHLDAR